MTHEFIPYEQALTLKELGFDEPCLTYYFDTLVDIVLYPETQLGSGFSLKGFKNSYKKFQPKDCAAPTFSQAFRWFREKYNLHYVIVKAESWFYTINGCNTQEGFNTYEEAELACLNKLIEIVKNGKHI